MDEQGNPSRRREQLRIEFGPLFDEISGLLFHHDPIGISAENNTDEYDLEAERILPRLQSCKTYESALAAIHEEFVWCFDACTAGSVSRYENVASAIWSRWQRHIGSVN
jgi:hypothetical protein